MRKHIRQKTKDPKPRLVIGTREPSHKNFDETELETISVCSRMSLSQRSQEMGVSVSCKDNSREWIEKGMKLFFHVANCCRTGR